MDKEVHQSIADEHNAWLLDLMISSNQRKEQVIKAKEQGIAKLQEEKEALQAEVAALKSLKGEGTTLSRENEILQDENRWLRKANEQLGKANRALSRENDSLSDILSKYRSPLEGVAEARSGGTRWFEVDPATGYIRRGDKRSEGVSGAVGPASGIDKAALREHLWPGILDWFSPDAVLDDGDDEDEAPEEVGSHYQVLEHDDPLMLEHSVSELILKGWLVSGGVAVTFDPRSAEMIYTQAMERGPDITGN